MNFLQPAVISALIAAFTSLIVVFFNNKYNIKKLANQQNQFNTQINIKNQEIENQQNQFTKEFQQKEKSLLLNISSQQSTTYKELITAERIKNHYKLQSDISMLLGKLYVFQNFMDDRFDYNKSFDELDSKIAKANDNENIDPLLDIYQQNNTAAFDILQKAQIVINDIMMLRNKIILTNIMGVFDKRNAIDRLVDTYIVTAEKLEKKSTTDDAHKRFISELEKTQQTLINLCKTLLDDDWNAIQEEAKLIFIKNK